MKKLLLSGVLIALSFSLSCQAEQTSRAVLADAVIDLRTPEGVALVQGEWRYHDVDILDVDHRAPGADLKPSGQKIRTHDISPKAGPRDFDDRSWERLDAATMETRRSTGRLAFNWYRLRLTVPERIGTLTTKGLSLILELVVDDYA